MKFAYKLFLLMTSLLTFLFALFGIWMLSSDFAQLLENEIAQGNKESSMFQFLFEMGYQTVEEYGEGYAVHRTLNSIADSVERGGSRIFAVREDGSYLYGGEFMEGNGEGKQGFGAVISSLLNSLNRFNTYGYCIRQMEGGYYMFTAARMELEESTIYLGLCRELTAIYSDRQSLVSRYRIALVTLFFIGGICIYLLSRYMTYPISVLDKLAGRIADGDYELRSHNKQKDEIGALARNFNRMADCLVEQMQQKVLEAKQKEDFTAAFAHELKTPLTSIIGYADMLNSMKLTDEECHEAYFYIYSQGKRLESLSHKLLELVSMDKSPVAFRPVSAKSLEQNIRATVRPVWRQRGVKGKVELEKAQLLGDEELLLSLLYNLLDNAMKALDKGDASFILMKGRSLEDGSYEVKVVDNGRGIPTEEISRITEAFYMVDKSRSRQEGGAGIGMALCQKIIHIHGGRLSIDSRLGEGTVMKVVFPAAEVRGRKPGTRNQTEDIQRRAEKRKPGALGQMDDVQRQTEKKKPESRAEGTMRRDRQKRRSPEPRAERTMHRNRRKREKWEPRDRRKIEKRKAGIGQEKGQVEAYEEQA